MEYYSKKLAMILALALAMAAAVQVTAQESQSDYLEPHNAARREVGLADLTWDAEAEAYAQNYAEQHRGDCQLVHSQGGPYGENLYGGFVGAGGDNWFAAHAVKAWVDEKPNYDYASNSCVGGTMCGHYTQVVWSKTTTVGCARVVCQGNVGVFIICSYSPPGNVGQERPF